jgi:hypothetical protein
MMANTNTNNQAGSMDYDPTNPRNQLPQKSSAGWYTALGKIGDQPGMDYWNKEIAAKGYDNAYRAFMMDASMNLAKDKAVGSADLDKQKDQQNSAGWYTALGKIGDQPGMDYWNKEIATKGYDNAYKAFRVDAAMNLAKGKAVGSGDIAPTTTQTQAQVAPTQARAEPVYNTSSLATDSSFNPGGSGDYLSQLKNKYGQYNMSSADPFLNLNSASTFVSSLMNGAGAGANFNDAQKAEARYDYMKSSQAAGVQGRVNDQDAQWLKMAGQNGYGYTQDSVLERARQDIFKNGQASPDDVNVLNYFNQGPDAWRAGGNGPSFNDLANKYGISNDMRQAGNEMGFNPLQSSGMFASDPYQDMQKRIENYGSLNKAQQDYLQQQLQSVSSGQRQQLQQMFAPQQAPQLQRPLQPVQQQNPYLQPFQQTAAYGQAVNQNWDSNPQISQPPQNNQASQNPYTSQSNRQYPDWGQNNNFQSGMQQQPYGGFQNGFQQSQQNPMQPMQQVAPQSMSQGMQQFNPYQSSFQQPSYQNWGQQSQRRGLLYQGQGSGQNQAYGQNQAANNNQNRYGLLSAYGSR